MSRDEYFAQLTHAAFRQLCWMLLSKPRASRTREESNWAKKETCIAQREITMFVVKFVGCKCLMSSHIYRGGLPSSRDSREFYHFLAIYMCWNCIENSRVFTSLFVLELPRMFRNWAKLALLALCWLSSPKLWAFGLVNWAIRDIKLTSHSNNYLWVMIFTQ